MVLLAVFIKSIKVICTDDVELDFDLIRNELQKMVYFDTNSEAYSLTVNIYFGNEYRLDTCSVQYKKQINQNKPEWIKLSCFLYNSTIINYDISQRTSYDKSSMTHS